MWQHTIKTVKFNFKIFVILYLRQVFANAIIIKIPSIKVNTKFKIKEKSIVNY